MEALNTYVRPRQSSSRGVTRNRACLGGAGAFEIRGAYAQLVNSGVVNVGGAVGTLVVSGNYTQTGTGTLNIDLSTSTSHDRLQISGLATLAGALNLTGLNGYSPAPGLSFPIITWGGYTGGFGSVGLPPLNFGVWHYRYSPGGFTIWVNYF